MNYLGVKNKIALTMKGETITDYEFDYSKESKNAIALWNDNTIVWYDKKTCKLIKKIEGLSGIVLRRDLFILTYDKYKGANALDGKTIILSDKYTDIIAHEYCIEVIAGKKHGAFTYEGKCIMPVNTGGFIFLESGMAVSSVNTMDYYGLYPYDGTGAIISNKYRYTFIDNEDVIIYQDPCSDPHNYQSFIIFSHTGEQLGRFRTKRCNFFLFDNAIKVEKNNKKGLVSFDGSEIVPPEFDFITEVGEKNSKAYILDKGDKAGIATIEKGITIPVEFDENIVLYNDYVVVKKDNKFALYTYEGEELIPLGSKTITATLPATPGVFKVSNVLNEETTSMLYIAPLNKYITPCSIKFDKEDENYYYLDSISDEWVKI